MAAISCVDAQFGGLEPSGGLRLSMISNAPEVAAAITSENATATLNAGTAAAATTVSITGATSGDDAIGEMAHFGQKGNDEQKTLAGVDSVFYDESNDAVKMSLTSTTSATTMTTTRMITTGFTEMETGAPGDLDEEGVRLVNNGKD